MTTGSSSPAARDSLPPSVGGWRISDLRFLLVLALPGLTAWGLIADPAGSAVRTMAVLLLFAALDAWAPGGRQSPGPVASSRFLDALPRLYAPCQWALQGVGAAVAWRSELPVLLGVAFAVGFVAGAQGITLAHELGHSRRRADRLLGWCLMGSVGYAHFMVEHYRGHHPRAATQEDPASARRGEGLWRFLPRTVGGSWRSAWRLESAWLRQRRRGWGTSPLLWAVGLQAMLILALVALSWKLLLFWVVQAAVAIWLLETVNYIEHYGLTREVRDGRREAFGLGHAWNADHVFTNSLLINLQRHSDHHVHPWKPYASLAALEPTPQLPTGYAGCLLLAAVPWAWCRVMDRRLKAWHADQAARFNPTGPGHTAASRR